MGEKVRAHILVSGRVQGVFFRRHAQDKAKELGLTGWAHNTIDGKVEIVAEGKKEKIGEFLKWCRQGSSLAKVDDVEVEYEYPKGEFDDFTIREFGF
ncbi:acylphosphatase [Patescibacteria group bacterium]|nr:acylphosphatase [Patescibacteria group bacterium]